MKANELRKGNLFYHVKNKINYGTHIVCEITKNGIVNEHSVLIPYNEVEHIPITEEWLKKLGFIGWDIGNYTMILSNGNFMEFGNIIAENINYVHQLQNLYFALTNEELKLKQDETH
jgi:hypothetical protein